MMFSYRRAMLHHEVWNTRFPAVAERYGLSEDQVRNACRSFGVPLPEKSYWKRFDKGRPVTVRRLSRFINRTTIDFGIDRAAETDYWDWDLAHPLFRDALNVPPIYVVSPGRFGNARWSKVYENADLAGWAAMDGTTPYDLYLNGYVHGPHEESAEVIIEVRAENREFLDWLREEHIGLSSPSPGRLLLGDLKYRCTERDIVSPTLAGRLRYANAFAAVLGAHDVECTIRIVAGL